MLTCSCNVLQGLTLHRVQPGSALDQQLLSLQQHLKASPAMALEERHQ
jgi:hypothetical protein